jgi:peptidoglycan/xylan/chitin deacetylase (PgdA/CDA1 family)
MSRVPAALSVDFEFFQHAPAYRTARGSASESAIGSDAVEFLLDAFDAADADATFFTVSDIAATHGGVLREVVERGHELASHSHSHRHLTDLTAAERREEFAVSKGRLEGVTGADVVGFRAPSFDIADDHFATLADFGYEYDSSVVPCRSIPGWYGGEFDTHRPVPASVVDPVAPAGLTEVPVAVMPGLRLPLTGTWIRFFGVQYTLLGMRLLARRGIAPVLYVHPWELVDLPEIEGVPKRVYYRSGEYMRRAVERILATDFEFVTVRSLAESVGAPADAPATDAPATDAAMSADESDDGGPPP